MAGEEQNRARDPLLSMIGGIFKSCRGHYDPALLEEVLDLDMSYSMLKSPFLDPKRSFAWEVAIAIADCLDAAIYAGSPRQINQEDT
jgi:hypothetical protein